MEYKRLTSKVDDYYNCNASCLEQKSFLNKDCPANSCGDCEHFAKILNRLGELEDKIENGTLIELPCEIGDTIYVITINKFIRIKDKLKASFTIEEQKVAEINYIRKEWYINGRLLNHACFFDKKDAEEELKKLNEDINL